MNAIIAVFLFIWFLLLPGLAVWKVLQKGRRKWALLIILSTFLYLGPIMGLLGVLASRRDVKHQATITPCPKCGGAKVSLTWRRMDRRTGKIFDRVPTPISWIYSPPNATFSYHVIVNLFLGFGFLFMFWAVHSGDTMTFEYGVIGDIATLGLGIPSVLGVLWALVEFFRADRVKLFHYKCRSCKYEWQKREDEVQEENTVEKEIPLAA